MNESWKMKSISMAVRQKRLQNWILRVRRVSLSVIRRYMGIIIVVWRIIGLFRIISGFLKIILGNNFKKLTNRYLFL